MAEPTTEYRIYRTQGAVLIRVGAVEIELSDAVAEALGRELAPPLARVAGTKTPWSAEQDELLRHLYLEEGITPHEIGARLGRTPGAIYVRLNRLGVSARNPLMSERRRAAQRRHAAGKAA